MWFTQGANVEVTGMVKCIADMCVIVAFAILAFHTDPVNLTLQGRLPIIICLGRFIALQEAFLGMIVVHR